MNIFEFTQALLRQRRLLQIGLAVVLLPVILLSFKLSDGKPTFRIGPSYESSAQFAVAPVGLESLAQTDLNPGDLSGPAELYAELVKSDTFVDALFENEGIRLKDEIRVEVAAKAPIVSATFVTGTRDEAISAALYAFRWLEDRLSDQLIVAEGPVTEAPVEEVDVSRPFGSRLDIEVAAGLGSRPADLFLIVDIGGGSEIAVPLARTAGSALEITTTLSRTMTVQLSLELGGTRQAQPVRITPPEMPVFADAVPAFVITVADFAIRESEDGLRVREAGIGMAWEQGEAFTSPGTGGTRDVSLVLLTPDPSATPIGGRRGPILLIAALTVGTLLLLALVISVDTWQREKLGLTRADGAAEEASAVVDLEPVRQPASNSSSPVAAQANNPARRQTRVPDHAAGLAGGGSNRRQKVEQNVVPAKRKGARAERKRARAERKGARAEQKAVRKAERRQRAERKAKPKVRAATGKGRPGEIEAPNAGEPTGPIAAVTLRQRNAQLHVDGKAGPPDPKLGKLPIGGPPVASGGNVRDKQRDSVETQKTSGRGETEAASTKVDASKLPIGGTPVASGGNVRDKQKDSKDTQKTPGRAEASSKARRSGRRSSTRSRTEPPAKARSAKDTSNSETGDQAAEGDKAESSKKKQRRSSSANLRRWS